MCDSDSEIERVSSEKSTPEWFDAVPFSKDYQLKMFGGGCSKSGTKLIFPLKKDKSLPYTTSTTTKKGRGIYMNIIHTH